MAFKVDSVQRTAPILEKFYYHSQTMHRIYKWNIDIDIAAYLDYTLYDSHYEAQRRK